MNIRGTSGSGKSYVVKTVLDQCTEVVPYFLSGRRRPLKYRAVLPNGRSLVVLGHYEIPCGGCDTISKQDDIFNLAREAAEQGYHVLFEGRLPSVDVKRTVPLSQAHPTLVLHIDLPLEECLKWVNLRRREKDPEAEDVNPKNTTNIYNQIIRTMERLREAGVSCFTGNREEVTAKVREVLGCE